MSLIEAQRAFSQQMSHSHGCGCIIGCGCRRKKVKLGRGMSLHVDRGTLETCWHNGTLCSPLDNDLCQVLFMLKWGRYATFDPGHTFWMQMLNVAAEYTQTLIFYPEYEGAISTNNIGRSSCGVYLILYVRKKTRSIIKNGDIWTPKLFAEIPAARVEGMGNRMKVVVEKDDQDGTWLNAESSWKSAFVLPAVAFSGT